eukprot:s2862_g16.t1
MVSCWVGSFSFELCCSGTWGVGLASCWDDAFNWDSCCVPEIQQRLINDGCDPLDVEDPAKLRSLSAEKGKGNWEQLIMECLDTYDTPENFRFFRRHSGLLGHDIAHVGNPDVCTAAGHSFFWGMLVFRLEQAPGYPPRDVGLEFSLCVPKSCSFSVVETIFVPYTLGRYLGLNWGPETPEVMSRWNVDKANTIPVEDMVNHFVHKIVAKHPKGPGGWYQQEWPYRQKLWQYQPRFWAWQAGMCLQLARCFGMGAQHDKAEPNGSRSSWLYGLRTFAPQRHIHDLWVARSGAEEMPQLHVLRLILQLLVCFQHTILLVDWLGGSGYAGIESFQPITSQVSKVLGRVNHTFACLSVVLSIRSMGSTLRAVRAAGGGLARSALAATTWTMRRWLRQACHLAFWMFFYVHLAREIPWKPFPNFTLIWYQDRLDVCRDSELLPSARLPKEVAAYLPMWLLSLLFVYEPVNQLLNLYRPAVTACHNMQIFESLFAVSVVGAGIGFIRHFSGNAGAVCIGMLVTAFCLWLEPELLCEGFRNGRRFVGCTPCEMLPGAFLCAWLLEARCLPARGLQWGLAVIGAALLVDWLKLPRTEVLQDAQPTEVANMVYSPQKIVGFFLGSGLHALGMALLFTEWEHSKKKAVAPSGWVLAMSRLSLGVNLTNIFALHYLRGRLLLMPIEFHHIHVMGYLLWAWLTAGVVSAIVHCCVMPYALIGDAALCRFADPGGKAKKS